MASFTPGPWYVHPDSSLAVRRESDDATVATTDNGGHPEPDIILIDDGEMNANAHLISVAPELYEALNEMVDRWEPDTEGQDRVMWENACEALRKARGAAA